EGDCKQGSRLPLQDLPPPAVLLPDLHRAPSLDDEKYFLIRVPFGIQRRSVRDLDEVASPDSFSAVELEKRALPTHARPRSERQVLHPVYSNAAVDRAALPLHELIVRCRRAPTLPVP